MAVTTSTDSGIVSRTTLFASATMLLHAQPEIVLGKMGMTKTLPKNKSRTITFRRPVPFSAKTMPLMEGVTPNSTEFTMEDVTATINQYGDVITTTDVVEDTHEDPVLAEIAAQAGENIGRTKEALTWAVLRAGTNVTYGNGSARGDVNTAISLNKQRAITRTLRNNKAKKITKVLDGSQNYSTYPVWGAYVAVGHTNLEADIRNIAGFTPVAEYGTRRTLCEQEIGSVEDVRYVLSSDLDAFEGAGSSTANGMLTTGGNVDVYPIIFYGADAFASIALKGREAVTPTVIPSSKVDKSDPLGQRAHVGWKIWHAALILNQSWLIRGEFGATSL